MSVSFGCRVMTGHVPSIQFQCNAHHECEEVPNIQDPCLLSHSGCWHNMPTQRHSRRPEAEHHHRWCFDASRYSRRRLLPAEWQSFEWFGDGQDIPRLILNMQSQNEKQDVWFIKFQYFWCFNSTSQDWDSAIMASEVYGILASEAYLWNTQFYQALDLCPSFCSLHLLWMYVSQKIPKTLSVFSSHSEYTVRSCSDTIFASGKYQVS